MVKLLKGAEVIAPLNQRLKQQAERLTEQGARPCLGIVRLGERADDLYYEKNAVKRCQSLGVDVRRFLLPQTATTREVLSVVEQINEDASIHGCLIFRPLPAQGDDGAVRAALSTAKDVDGITDGSLAGVLTGAAQGFPPCTAQACLEILDHYGYDLSGKKVTLLGRSLVVGRPLALLLLGRNATVTVCHSFTGAEDIRRLSRGAEVVVSCLGRPEMVDAGFMSPGQIWLDVGINPTPEGGFVGDLRFADAEKTAQAVTPVPGGVGTVTTSVLVKQVIMAAARQNGINL